MTRRRPVRDRGRISGSLAMSRRVTDQVVLERDHDRDALAEERDQLQLRGVGRRGAQDAQVESAVQHAGDDLARRPLLEDESHPRVLVEEAGQPLGQPAGPDGVEESEVDLPGLGRHGAGGLRDGVAHLAQDALCPADEAPSGFGQPDRTADPLEERHSHLVLQTCDLSADGGLVILERFGRSAQMLQARHFYESPQEIGIDAIHASI
jgi:hypothetical protein